MRESDVDWLFTPGVRPGSVDSMRTMMGPRTCTPGPGADATPPDRLRDLRPGVAADGWDGPGRAALSAGAAPKVRPGKRRLQHCGGRRHSGRDLGGLCGPLGV